MTEPLRGPDDRYTVAIEAEVERPGCAPERLQASEGTPVWDPARAEAPCFLVLVGEACSVVLVPGSNGLTVRNLKLLDAAKARVTALVSAGAGAPDWLPTESRYVIFDGSRREARGWSERFIPFEGLTGETPPAAGESTSLDQLAIAVGRSVARANAALARSRSEAGVALVSSVTFRVAVEQTSLGQGRVQLTLGRNGEAASAQFVEFTMQTVPGAQSNEEEQPAPRGDRQSEQPTVQRTTGTIQRGTTRQIRTRQM